MKIIAGVHAGRRRRNAGRRQSGPLPLVARRAGGRYRHGASGAQRRAGAERRRECLFGRAARRSLRDRRLAADGARPPPCSCRTSASTSTRRARLGDFPIGVQQLVELSRVLFSGARIIILDEPTSALVAAGDRAPVRRPRQAARERPQHHLHFAFPRRHPEDFKRHHHLSQRPQGRHDRRHAGHRQGLDHRADDRFRPRGAGGKLSRPDQARQPTRARPSRYAPAN